MRRHIAAAFAVAVGLGLMLAVREAPTDACQLDVRAAFQQLDVRPFRSEMTNAYTHQLGVKDVVPPDRSHVITTTRQGEVLDERIQVGQRSWSGKDGRWSELPIQRADIKLVAAAVRFRLSIHH